MHQMQVLSQGVRVCYNILSFSVCKILNTTLTLKK